MIFLGLEPLSAGRTIDIYWARGRMDLHNDATLESLSFERGGTVRTAFTRDSDAMRFAITFGGVSILRIEHEVDASIADWEDLFDIEVGEEEGGAVLFALHVGILSVWFRSDRVEFSADPD